MKCNYNDSCDQEATHESGLCNEHLKDFIDHGLTWNPRTHSFWKPVTWSNAITGEETTLTGAEAERAMIAMHRQSRAARKPKQPQTGRPPRRKR